MACQFSTDLINTISETGLIFSKDGSNLCVKIGAFGALVDERSYPLTDTDLSIADDIVNDIKASLSADQLAILRRALSIKDLVWAGLMGD